MTHGTNFNQIAFIDWSKMFIMPKHVFYNSSYATIISNTIFKMTKNVLAISNQPINSRHLFKENFIY